MFFVKLKLLAVWSWIPFWAAETILHKFVFQFLILFLLKLVLLINFADFRMRSKTIRSCKSLEGRRFIWHIRLLSIHIYWISKIVINFIKYTFILFWFLRFVVLKSWCVSWLIFYFVLYGLVFWHNINILIVVYISYILRLVIFTTRRKKTWWFMTQIPNYPLWFFFLWFIIFIFIKSFHLSCYHLFESVDGFFFMIIESEAFVSSFIFFHQLYLFLADLNIFGPMLIFFNCKIMILYRFENLHLRCLNMKIIWFENFYFLFFNFFFLFLNWIAYIWLELFSFLFHDWSLVSFADFWNWKHKFRTRQILLWFCLFLNHNSSLNFKNKINFFIFN